MCYACNLVCGLELAFPSLFYKKFHENRMCHRFLAENLFLLIFCVYFEYARNVEDAHAL